MGISYFGKHSFSLGEGKIPPSFILRILKLIIDYVKMIEKYYL